MFPLWWCVCEAVTQYLKIIIIHLTVMLVVVWVVHLIEELNSEPPRQARLGHKHMLEETRFAE